LTLPGLRGVAHGSPVYSFVFSVRDVLFCGGWFAALAAAAGFALRRFIQRRWRLLSGALSNDICQTLWSAGSRKQAMNAAGRRFAARQVSQDDVTNAAAIATVRASGIRSEFG
jgi:hypothetical protein